MEWIYRVSNNLEFPDPVAEIEALAAIDQAGDAAFLLLDTATELLQRGNRIRVSSLSR
jgi:hypothetical protein